MAADAGTSFSFQQLSAALATGQVVDAGDFYWASDQRVPLLRVADEIVVKLDNSTSLASLSQPGGPLAGYQLSAQLNSSLISLTATQPVTEQSLANLKSRDDISWTGFAYINSNTGERLWGTGELIVALDPGVDPASFFSTDYVYQGLTGTADQFVVTVTGGQDAHGQRA